MDDYLDIFEIKWLFCCLIVAENFMEFQGGVTYKVLLIKKACISQINEILKQLCSRNNFIFVEHKNIGFDDLS